MAKVAYIKKRLRPATLETVATANAIIEEYAAQGLALTLRQLFYRFVAKGLIENEAKAYKNFGNVIKDGRLAGLIDWDAIVDRTRNLRENGHYRDPATRIRLAAASYQIDKWARQSFRPQVWVEKDAAIGVVEEVCRRLDVPFFSCRGYNSTSEMREAGRRLEDWRKRGQTPIILHFGDHDPSGIDMTRDVEKRLGLFAGKKLRVERIALNWDQVERFSPPPNPVKKTDTRAKAYIARFGLSSWELDALDPATVADLIESTVARFRDENLWAEAVEEEEEGLDLLRKAAVRWKDVVGFLES